MPELDPRVAEGLTQIMNGLPFNQHIGLVIDRLEYGFARMKIPFREELVGNIFQKRLHGGVISTLLDTAGGTAVCTTFTDARDRISTIDLRIDFLRPGGSEELVAEAEVLRAGSQVASVEVVAFHESKRDEPVATGKGVYAIRLARDQTP